MKTCDICAEKHYCRGYCRRHYSAWKKHGDPLVKLRFPNQPKPTCTAREGCTEPQKAKGLCVKHYARLKRVGSDELPERPRCSEMGCDEVQDSRGRCKRHYQLAKRRGEFSTRTCEEADCDRNVTARGWCDKHYKEFQQYGEILPEGARKRIRGQCTWLDCQRPHKAGGLCDMHYLRNRATGDPGSSEPKPVWADEVTYAAVHHRLRNHRGRAAEYTCVDCGRRAREWSYTYSGCEDERSEPSPRSDTPLFYSLDINHYVPRCKQCHMAHDFRERKERMNEYV